MKEIPLELSLLEERILTVTYKERYLEKEMANLSNIFSRKIHGQSTRLGYIPCNCKDGIQMSATCMCLRTRAHTHTQQGRQKSDRAGSESSSV